MSPGNPAPTFNPFDDQVAPPPSPEGKELFAPPPPAPPPPAPTFNPFEDDPAPPASEPASPPQQLPPPPPAAPTFNPFGDDSTPPASEPASPSQQLPPPPHLAPTFCLKTIRSQNPSNRKKRTTKPRFPRRLVFGFL